MTQITLLPLPKIYLLIIGILASSIIYAAPEQNQSTSASSTSNSSKHKKLRSEELDFSWTGRPNKQTAGGSRPYGCPESDGTFTALVPKNMGLAVTKSATFWFHVPYKFQDVESGEFVLQGTQGELDLYRTRVTLSQTPGIIGVQLPLNIKGALQLNRPYLWSFVVFCKPNNTDVNVFVEGFVQWVSLEPAPQDYVQYAHKRIWHDALTDLAERRRQAPQDPRLKNDWLVLFKSVGLGKLVEEPLLPCCTTEK